MNRQTRQELEAEHAMWCALAMLWESAKVGVGGWSDLGAYGLCSMIFLYSPTTAVLNRARKRMHTKYRRRDGWIIGYWWPLTQAGARARAKFCWGMAEECEREMNK